MDTRVKLDGYICSFRHISNFNSKIIQFTVLVRCWILIFALLNTPVFTSGHSSSNCWILHFSMLDTSVFTAGYSSSHCWKYQSDAGYFGHHCWILLFSQMDTRVELEGYMFSFRQISNFHSRIIKFRLLYVPPLKWILLFSQMETQRPSTKYTRPNHCIV